MFVIRSFDKKDHLALRQENRPAHIEYLKSFGEKLFSAGAILDDNGTMCGSIVILDVTDLAAAETFAAGDPYVKAGLFASRTIDRWNKVSL